MSSRAPPMTSSRMASVLSVIVARSNPAENLPGRPVITTDRASDSARSSASCRPRDRVVADGVGLAVVEGDDGDAVVQPVGQGFGHGAGA